MSPLRVMHVVYGLRTGGMEMGVVKLVNGLDGRRVRSSVCSTTPAGPIKTLVSPSVPVFEMSRRKGNDVRIVSEMYRLFRREQPHIVHTHSWGTLIEGLAAARLARVPAVVHGEHGTLQLRRYQRVLQRAAWAATDRLLSVSSRLSERMARETGYPLDRITTIRNGVDLARFGAVSRADARRALGLDAGTPVVGTVGRLVPVKDHVGLVEAMAGVCRSEPRAVLLLAGDGPEQAAIEARVEALGLRSSVRLLGHRPDVETVLAALDLFVLSSVSEGLSNTILEAMAAGAPVVATRVGGADEMVVEGATGLLVESGQAGALATAIAGLLADDARRAAMGAAGRRRVEAEFELAGMVRRYDALYESVAREKGVADVSTAPLDSRVGAA